MGTTTIDEEALDDMRRAWELDCRDAFGRPAVLTVTAYRAPGAGIGVKAPTGEYGYVTVDHLGDLDYVLAEARRFIEQDSGGGWSCTPRR